MKMKFSIMPSRAVSDPRLQPNVVRTLSALCCFTSANQICYPNQSTLGDLIGVSRALVTRNMGILRECGYIVDLVPVGKKHPWGYKRGNRYFVPTREGDPVPPLEVQRTDVISSLRLGNVTKNEWGSRGGK